MTNNKSILFKPEYSLELFQISKGDLDSAKALMDSPRPGRPENILYMIQQSVEKTLKAVLVKKQIAFPLIHDLGVLIALLPPADYPPGGFDWTALNLFATVRRYEEGSIPLSKEEISSSYLAALQVINWANKHIL